MPSVLLRRIANKWRSAFDNYYCFNFIFVTNYAAAAFLSNAQKKIARFSSHLTSAFDGYNVFTVIRTCIHHIWHFGVVESVSSSCREYI